MLGVGTDGDRVLGLHSAHQQQRPGFNRTELGPDFQKQNPAWHHCISAWHRCWFNQFLNLYNQFILLELYALVLIKVDSLLSYVC